MDAMILVRGDAIPRESGVYVVCGDGFRFFRDSDADAAAHYVRALDRHGIPYTIRAGGEA